MCSRKKELKTSKLSQQGGSLNPIGEGSTWTQKVYPAPAASLEESELRACRAQGLELKTFRNSKLPRTWICSAQSVARPLIHCLTSYEHYLRFVMDFICRTDIFCCGRVNAGLAFKRQTNSPCCCRLLVGNIVHQGLADSTEISKPS